MSLIGSTATKPKQILVLAAIAGTLGCAGGNYNAPVYPNYPYNTQVQNPALPYGTYPQVIAPPSVVMPGTAPQGSVMPPTTVLPQANATFPGPTNTAGTTGLPFGYPIGTDLTRTPPQLVPQGSNVLPTNTGIYQPNAYTASVPYPNTDDSTRHLINFR